MTRLCPVLTTISFAARAWLKFQMAVWELALENLGAKCVHSTSFLAIMKKFADHFEVLSLFKAAKVLIYVS